MIFQTVSHCAFSSNLFHGQITQKHIDHLSAPENVKCSVNLFQKNFGILYFMEQSDGRYFFELFASETNLKKKRSVSSKGLTVLRV